MNRSEEVNETRWGDCPGGGLLQRLRASASARARQSQAAMWDRSCDVLRKGTVTDRYGRPAAGEEAVAFKAACSAVQDNSWQANEEVEEADRRVSVALWRVSMAVGADIRGTDRLRVFGLDERGERVGTGLLLEVTATNADQSGAFQLLVYAKQTGEGGSITPG